MRHSMTFIGGVIVGAGMVLTAGYMAGFQRPVPQPPVPTVAQVQAQPLPKSGWEDFTALEARVPKHLQQCVSAKHAAIFSALHANVAA